MEAVPVAGDVVRCDLRRSHARAGYFILRVRSVRQTTVFGEIIGVDPNAGIDAWVGASSAGLLRDTEPVVCFDQVDPGRPAQ